MASKAGEGEEKSNQRCCCPTILMWGFNEFLEADETRTTPGTVAQLESSLSQAVGTVALCLGGKIRAFQIIYFRK